MELDVQFLQLVLLRIRGCILIRLNIRVEWFIVSEASHPSKILAPENFIKHSAPKADRLVSKVCLMLRELAVVD